MINVMDLVNRYVAVWNEPNADERRKRIRSVWAPDGTTCYRLLDARGYEAIEARVTGSWDKWLREGKYIFQPKQDVACHHDVVRLNFAMVTVPDGKVEARGLTFLILNSDGYIQHDYQFNPTADDAQELLERYLAVWNEPNPEARRERIADLWASDGAYISETSVRNGHSAIEAEAAEGYQSHFAQGLVFSSASLSHRHHNLARLRWCMRGKDSGEVKGAGSDLLILDDRGRIRFDYRFQEVV